MPVPGPPAGISPTRTARYGLRSLRLYLRAHMPRTAKAGDTLRLGYMVYLFTFGNCFDRKPQRGLEKQSFAFPKTRACAKLLCLQEHHQATFRNAVRQRTPQTRTANLCTPYGLYGHLSHPRPVHGLLWSLVYTLSIVLVL
jgi:hypothetical protein